MKGRRLADFSLQIMWFTYSCDSQCCIVSSSVYYSWNTVSCAAAESFLNCFNMLWAKQQTEIWKVCGISVLLNTVLMTLLNACSEHVALIWAGCSFWAIRILMSTLKTFVYINLELNVLKKSCSTSLIIITN